MKQSLPWESVPPPIYTAKALKPRKKWVTVGGWILVMCLLVYGLTSPTSSSLLKSISLIFAVLYTLTLLTKKDIVLTGRGLEIFYNMQVTTQYEFYPWEEINAIVCEDRNHNDLVRLHIGYGNMEKAAFFNRSEIDAIYKLAKTKNPAIRIMDYASAPPKTSQKHKKKR